MAEHKLKTRDGAVETFYDKTSVDTQAPAMLFQAGNPNGVVTGKASQHYLDSNTGLTYFCFSNPSGTAWQIS